MITLLSLGPAENEPAPDPLLTPAPNEAPAPDSIPNRNVLDPDLVDATQSATTVDWTAVIGYSGLVAIALGLTVIAVTTLWWMLYAWRSKSNYDSTAFSEEPLPPQHTFTLLVPGRHEEEVMGQTLDALAAQTHPDVQIIAIVGDDDPGTTAVVRAAAERHPDRIEVVVDDSVPKNKPKALNRALPYAAGSIVGVFDAEDEVHPELLRHIDSRFTESGATVVQGGVQLMNFRTTWWSLRNVLEYYFWFRSRLHFHAGAQFIPLGGNTVFVKRDALERNDGWDAECLAEDCELGVRLSSQGEKVVVAYSPEYVTREETPGTLKSFYKQRTRWNQGFLQVLRKGEWRALPTRSQRAFARYMLSMPFLQDPSAPAVETVAAIPERVQIPSIGVDSTLEGLALGDGGRLEAPVDFDLAGWYSDGVLPGQVGPAIIAGHVDSPTAPAVFADIGDLVPGDEVIVTLSDGSAVNFLVSGSMQSAKAEFPTATVYSNVPTPQLRLITCGGTFDSSTGHYLDNLIVFAELRT